VPLITCTVYPHIEEYIKKNGLDIKRSVPFGDGTQFVEIDTDKTEHSGHYHLVVSDGEINFKRDWDV
jgi:hypothetical protein